MEAPRTFIKELEHFNSYLRTKLFIPLINFLAFNVSPFSLQLFYFLIFSAIGFLALKKSNPRISSFKLDDFDLFFTSVSATTVSSMSTIEMEVFSDFQLITIIVLMLLGGPVFTSMLGLLFRSLKFLYKSDNFHPKHINALRYLRYVVLAYLFVVHAIGSSLIALYIGLTPSAYKVLKNKGLKLHIFSIFLTVSTFSNCGFVPTNENMIVFAKNSGLLVLLIPQILLGNSLYPPCLRLILWTLKSVTKKEEFVYMLDKKSGEIYRDLMSTMDSLLLGISTIGFVAMQFVLFCAMEWNSGLFDGAVSSTYQKLVASVFQTVNSRHTGQSVVDLNVVAPAILILFVIMMYLPPYTFFKPTKKDEASDDMAIMTNVKRARGKKIIGQNMLLSQISYLAIFIILICITERKKLKDDPINFSVLNIVVEVVSAYGNVGFSTSYSCKRRLINLDQPCKDAGYGFVGRWSKGGKFILILVMFFGRLKMFNLDFEGGKAWKLL